MSAVPRFLLLVSLSLFFLASCENVALFPRPDIDRRTDLPRRDISGDIAERDLSPDEIFATVDRIDDVRQELYLRTAEGQTEVMKYDSNTLVASGNRDLSVSSLRPSDQVRVRSSSGVGGEYADFIRIEALETGSSRYQR
jgi:hypothetical protein